MLAQRGRASHILLQKRAAKSRGGTAGRGGSTVDLDVASGERIRIALGLQLNANPRNLASLQVLEFNKRLSPCACQHQRLLKHSPVDVCRRNHCVMFSHACGATTARKQVNNYAAKSYSPG